jgi:two-component system, sensor histidine kinase and response regulator
VRHWAARGRAAPLADAPRNVVFDAGALARAVGNDAAALAGIRIAYLARSRQDLREMQRAVEANQWAAAGALAHRWKSASRSVGAVALAQRLHALEKACRDGGAEAGGIAGSLQADLAAVERALS